MRGSEKIFVSNNDIRLETELFLSEEESSPFAALVCHPHPQFLGI
ncbi:MAG: hypothetical protein ACXABG_09045 [Promethearchaeota archaeon]|jgi:alpha/beta superfamily hydrolase